MENIHSLDIRDSIFWYPFIRIQQTSQKNDKITLVREHDQNEMYQIMANPSSLHELEFSLQQNPDIIQYPINRLKEKSFLTLYINPFVKLSPSKIALKLQKVLHTSDINPTTGK